MKSSPNSRALLAVALTLAVTSGLAVAHRLESKSVAAKMGRPNVAPGAPDSPHYSYARTEPGAPRVGPHMDPDAPGFSWPAADCDRDGVFDRVDRCPNTPLGDDVDQWGCSMARPARAARPSSADRAGSRGLREELRRTGRIRLEMAFFDTDRAVVRRDAWRSLDEVAAIIRDYPSLKFEVGGHADSRGRAAHNLELSRARARQVADYLEYRGGVRRIQLCARGYGESRPATGERDAEELQANRRVEFRIVNPEAMGFGSRVERRDAMEFLAATEREERDRLVAAR